MQRAGCDKRSEASRREGEREREQREICHCLPSAIRGSSQLLYAPEVSEAEHATQTTRTGLLPLSTRQQQPRCLCHALSLWQTDHLRVQWIPNRYMTGQPACEQRAEAERSCRRENHKHQQNGDHPTYRHQKKQKRSEAMKSGTSEAAGQLPAADHRAPAQGAQSQSAGW
jgi:hypothetical protein